MLLQIQIPPSPRAALLGEGFLCAALLPILRVVSATPIMSLEVAFLSDADAQRELYRRIFLPTYFLSPFRT